MTCRLTPRIGLLDADIIAYASSAATESSWDFEGDGDAIVCANLDAAKEAADLMVTQYQRLLNLDEMVIALSDIGDNPTNYRKVLDPTYKASRKEIKRPENLLAMKRWLSERYRSYWKPGLEGDDVLGILATHPTLVKGERIMISGDKDLRQIPGKLYVPHSKERLKITQLDGDRWFMTQTLTGDPTDGYGGCRGVGEKSPYVTRVNEAGDLKAMWDIVVEAYRAAHGSKAKEGRKTVVVPDQTDVPVQHAVGQARLARILRWPEWDTEGKRPILWQAPG